jgi:hypothetical protein
MAASVMMLSTALRFVFGISQGERRKQAG